MASGLGSPKAIYTDFAADAQVSVGDASAVVSLTDGQRLSHNRNSDTDCPSEITTELRGDSEFPIEKGGKSGYGEGLGIGEELGVGDVLGVGEVLGVAASVADCD